MKVLIIRNTVNGPARGDVLDLPDDQAKALIQAGTAEPAPEKPEVAEEPAAESEHTEKQEHKAKHTEKHHKK